MAATTGKRVEHTGNIGLFIIAGVLYLSFIGLFLWQTLQFVNWLFPNDQIIWRVITVATFDVLAVVWALLDTFYRFATRGMHTLVKWSWGISFVASLIASVFYMSLQSMTRLNFTPDATAVNIGYAIVIIVTVLQILFLTFFIRGEWLARHPKTNDYEYESVEIQPVPVLQGQATGSYPVLRQDYSSYSAQNQPQTQITEERIVQLMTQVLEANKTNNPNNLQLPARSGGTPKPFSQARQQTAAAARPMKKLPPLHRGQWIVNPFKRKGRMDSQGASTVIK